MVGGGSGSTSGNGIGGSGGCTKTVKISVKPGSSVQINIASGGIATWEAIRADGSSTIINVNSADFTAIGGLFNAPKSSGGSGGGAESMQGGNGGSDGSNGYHGNTFGGSIIHGEAIYIEDTSSVIGTGQGTTTRAFGEQEGTLYAGGGGGIGRESIEGSDNGWGRARGGYGGAGGGGNGAFTYPSSYWMWGSTGTSGAVNTGGGGGGGGNAGKVTSNWGGSGIAIIRWGY